MVIEAARGGLFCLERNHSERRRPQDTQIFPGRAEKGLLAWSHKEFVGYGVSGAKGVLDYINAAEISSKMGPRSLCLACL